MKGLVPSNTHLHYESSITSGKKVMAKVKVFVHASNPDAGYDISSPDIRPCSLKITIGHQPLLLPMSPTGNICCDCKCHQSGTIIFISLRSCNVTVKFKHSSYQKFECKIMNNDVLISYYENFVKIRQQIMISKMFEVMLNNCDIESSNVSKIW